MNTHWTPEKLTQLNEIYGNAYPEDVLAWAFQTFGSTVSLATGFGPEGVVLMHMLSRVTPQMPIFYLDTDLFFPETYALRDQLQEKLGLTFLRVTTQTSLSAQAQTYGDELWAENPNLCCQIRKVAPLRQYLSTQQAWVTAIRRSQTLQRANAQVIEWDRANGLVKLNPLAFWSFDDVWMYIQINDLPTNALHEQGYKSIGCFPCTRAVLAGEDERAGRWAGRQKVECGIHLQPGATSD
ncbi:MAG TPA: phosphoadenylyl-sulfate reductase [Anaerolineales bacterium]|nr:phosphoadenylyl-sulfate reductase [Anaerolineales bacterium]